MQPSMGTPTKLATAREYANRNGYPVIIFIPGIPQANHRTGMLIVANNAGIQFKFCWKPL